MAFVCTENFDSYADNDNLNGKSGGSGWTSNWGSTFTGPATVQNTQAYSGTLSCFSTSDQISRDFTTVTAGTLYFAFFKTGDDNMFWLRDGATNFVATRINGGNLQYLTGGGASWATIQAVNSSQWYVVGIEIDQTNQSGKARYNVDGGTWTAWADGGSGTQANRVLVWGTQNIYIDSIQPTSPIVVTVNGNFLAFM